MYRIAEMLEGRKAQFVEELIKQDSTKEDAEKIFNGLSSGGNVEVPMSEGMGLYMGMFRDKYGIEWIIEFSQGE